MAVEFVSASSQRANLGLALPFLNGKPAVTVMAWVKPLILGATKSISEQAIGPPPGTSGTSRMFFNVLAGGNIQLGVRPDDAAGSITLNGVGALVAGAWAHVAGLANIAGDVMRLFINGALDASSSPAFGPASFPATDSKNGHVGSNDDGGGQFFDGVISDFRMYDRALSLSEIGTVYAARGRDSVLRGLVHRLKLSGVPGVAASVAGEFKDVSISQRHADPVNGPVYREPFVSGYRRRVG